jgi:hypothetical protein
MVSIQKAISELSHPKKFEAKDKKRRKVESQRAICHTQMRIRHWLFLVGTSGTMRITVFSG